MSHNDCQIQITDLIAEAVSNAKARRNQVTDSGVSASPLSNEEAERIAGGSGYQEEEFHTAGMFSEQTQSTKKELQLRLQK